MDKRGIDPNYNYSNKIRQLIESRTPRKFRFVRKQKKNIYFRLQRIMIENLFQRMLHRYLLFQFFNKIELKSYQ